jgi:glucosamine--fructose-6-phosphate aminotransferase (isomerizing)
MRKQVIAHLANRQLTKGCTPVDAVRAALPRLGGAFALAFLFEGYDDMIIGARKDLRLRLVIAEARCISGGTRPLSRLTDMINYLEDGDVALSTRHGIGIGLS